MAEENRLRPLRMCITGKDDIELGFGFGDERVLQKIDSLNHKINRFDHPQTKICRHLIVAASSGVVCPPSRR